jgi:hypothetical protein
VGLLFGAVPLAAVLGMLGYFGFATLNWNGEPLTGTSALVGGPFMGLFFALWHSFRWQRGSPWALDIFEVCKT